MDKAEAFDKMQDLLEGFHAYHKYEIENEEPMNGAQAVDDLVSFWVQVDNFFKELNA